MKNSISIANGIGFNGTLISTGPGTPTVSTAITPISIKGGVIRNIDQATGDIARTTSGWIEDEKYGRYAVNKASSWSAEFDSSVTRTGRLTLKVSLTDATGRAIISTLPADPASASTTESLIKKYGIPVKAGTSYETNCYVKTSNITAGTVVQVLEYNATGTKLVSNSLSSIGSTVDWTLATSTITTNASTAYVIIICLLNTAGNISDAWFDINSMTLEEVSTITNSLSTPVQFYPKVTAVTSTDNIDQSQVVSDNAGGLGTATLEYRAQQFTPTKKNLSGITFRRQTSSGTYVGNVTVSIQADSSTAPSGTDLGTPIVIPNATWEAITTDTDYTISYPLTLTIGQTYWIVFKSSTVDADNRTSLRIQATAGYAGGVMKTWNGSVWSAASTADLYFKTLYSKNTTNFTVRTDTETLSVTAPTVEGWENGEVIDTTDGTYGITPLTLAAGDNTVYVSSNGSTLADSDTDESLQATLNGVMVG